MAGTRVPLATDTDLITSVTMTAEFDNTGTVTVGAGTVVDSLATRRGIPLEAKDSWTVKTNQLANVELDAEINGDGVTWAAEGRA